MHYMCNWVKYNYHLHNSLQNKYTHIMTLFACCMADMVQRMYFRISRSKDINKGEEY